MMFVRFRYIPRLTIYPAPPATVQINNRAFKGKGPSLKLPVQWNKDFLPLVNSEQAIRYLLKAKSGWVNGLAEDGTPIAESITMGGNIAEVVDQVPGFYRLRALTPDSPFPDPNDRLLVHRFTCVTLSGQMRLPAGGLDVFYPFLLKDGYAWVNAKSVDVFDFKPLPLFPGPAPAPHGYAAVVLAGAVVRQAPKADANKIEKLSQAEDVWVTDEVNGWACIGYKQYIELSYVRRV